MGDGYIKSDLTHGGKFDIDAQRGIDHLFAIEPFKRYKSYFNTYLVYAESNQQGVTSDRYGQGNTRFKTYFSSGMVLADMAQCSFYAEKAVAKDKITVGILIVNATKGGGTAPGHFALVSNSTDFESILVHEIGHAFALLGDEYSTAAPGTTYDFSACCANLDTVSDIKKIKWAHFFDNSSKYSDVLGAFEGGFYQIKGVYRPEENSVMRDVSTLSFNAPSRESIARRIHKLIGMPFDFNEFLKNDEPSIYPIFAPRKSSFILPPRDFLHIKELEKIMQTGKLLSKDVVRSANPK
jgi:hypothetical protein